MAESYFQRRSRELGLNLPAGTSTEKPSSNDSYFTRRAKELGLNLNPQPVQDQQAPTSNYASKRLVELQQERSALSSPAANLKPESIRHIQDMQEKRLSPTGDQYHAPVTSPINPTDQLNAALNFTARPAPPSPMQTKPTQPTGIPSFQQQVNNIQSQVGTGQSATEKWLQEQKVRRQERGQEHPVYGAIDSVVEPINEFFDRLQTLPGVSGFLQGANAAATGNRGFAPPVTGSPWVNKPAELIGNLAGLASVPAGGMGQNAVTAPIQVGQKLTSDISNPLARVAARGITEGTLGGITGSLAAGQSDADELSRNALLGGALGLGGEALAGLPGALARNARNAATGITRGNVNTASAIESAANSVPTGRLKVQGNTEKLSRLIDQIKPVVTERMTPPLENPNQLAKWLQPHLNASLNQIRKLRYEDLRELATEVQRSLSVEDVARQAARERGVDLDALLNQTAPTFRQEAERMRLGGVAGAIEPPANARVAISDNFKAVEPEYAKILEQTTSTNPRQSWFSRLFGEQNVGISAFGGKKGNNIVTTADQIVNNPLKNSTTGALNNAKAAARNAYQAHVDFVDPLKKISPETYSTAIDVSRANNLANTSLRDAFVDLEGNVIGDSLDDVFAAAPRGIGKKLDDYIILRHAETRLKRGENVYDKKLEITPEKARALADTYEERYPELVEAGRKWDEFNKNNRDLWEREGLITPELKKEWEAENPHYASMRRQFTTKEKLSHPKFSGKGSGFSGYSAPVQEVSPTGSHRRIVSPFRSAIEQTQAGYQAMLRNRVMQQIIKEIQTDPERMKGIATIVKKPSTSFKSLDEALRDGGSEKFLEELDRDFTKLFQRAQPGDETIVRGMVKGRAVYVKVEDPDAVKALLGLGPEQSGLVLDVLKSFSNATKRGATGLFAPLFAVKNLTSDAVQSAIQAPNAAQHLAVDLPAAFFSSIGDAFKIPGLRNLAQDFRRTGGEYSSLLRGDRQLNRSVQNMRREAFLSPKGIAKGIGTTIKTPFKVLEGVGDFAENLNRMAAFRRSRVRNQERTPQNIRNAITAGREITTNYSRKGLYSPETEALIPYSNAAIQGLYRITRAFKKNPVKTIAGIGTLVVAPKLYEYAQFNEDPDYQKLPARERYRNLIVSKNSDGTFNKIPLPPEYAAFGSFLTDVLNSTINNDPQAYKGTLDSVVNAFTPPIVSGALQGATQGGGVEQSIKGTFNATTVAPFAALFGNQSFTGAPIVPERLADNSKKYQYDEKTSGVAKWVGDKIGLAPLKVDYLLRAYGGDPSRILLPLNSPVGAGTPRNTLLKNFIVDPVFTNTLSNDFFAAKEAYTNAANDNKDFNAPLPKWYNESDAKLLTSQAKGSANKRLSELNEQKRNITGDKTLNAKQKADKLRDVQSQINQIYVDVNSQLKDFPFPNR